MTGFSKKADFLLQNQAKWKPILEEALNLAVYPELDTQWGKFVLHDVPLDSFNHEEGLLNL